MDFKYYPRVLIITVNPLSNTSNNGKTYASFFKGYPKQNIAQLYFHREIPTSNICENYYRISDEDVVANFMGKSKSLGSRVYKGNKEKRLIPENINNKFKGIAIARFIRSLIWLFVDLKKDGVRPWLDKFNPEVIFFCGGNANYLYEKVLKLSQEYNAKIVYYITDDYILPYFSLNIFDQINRIWTRKVFRKICNKSSMVLTIGTKMSKIYKEKYGVLSNQIMNLVEVNKEKTLEGEIKTNNLQFVYVGGLHSNRWEVLALIGKSLERIAEQGYIGNLKIYSHQKPDEKMLRKLSNKNYSRYCGSLDPEGVKRTLNEADVVVHVESFDRKSKKTTYLSVSTKIPEYMSTRKTILAMGPKDVASIEYLMDTKTAFIISDMGKETTDNTIINIFEDTEKREQYIKEAFITVKRNHDIDVKRKEFQQNIIKLIKH